MFLIAAYSASLAVTLVLLLLRNVMEESKGSKTFEGLLAIGLASVLSPGVLGLVYTYGGEVFELKIRGTAVGLAYCLGQLADVYMPALDELCKRSGIDLVVGSNFLCPIVLLLLFGMPETLAKKGDQKQQSGG